MTKAKSKARSMASVPQNREAAIAALQAIGSAKRMIQDICAAADEKAREIAAQRDADTVELRERVKTLEAGLQAYCEANRDALTDGGKVKSHNFGPGTVSWRFRPPKVRISGGVEGVIDACHKLGLGRFLRVKTEINKDAMQEEPEVASLVPGVSIGSEGEDFTIEILELGNSQAEAA